MSISPEEFDWADAWKPDPGELIEGVVVEITTRDGEYGSYPIVTLELVDGERRAIHAFHSVLRNELARIAPQTGSRIAVLYKGKVTRSDGPDFHSYRVKAVGGESKAFDWNGEQQMALEDPTPSGNGEASVTDGAAVAAVADDVPF